MPGRGGGAEGGRRHTAGSRVSKTYRESIKLHLSVLFGRKNQEEERRRGHEEGERS